MVMMVKRATKGIIFLLVVILSSFLFTIDFSSCQQSDTQFRASIWVSRGCGSSYSEGDPITIYFTIEAPSVPCSECGTLEESGSSSEGSGISPLALAQSDSSYNYISPPTEPPSQPSPQPYSSLVLVSIIDHYPNNAGSHYLIQDGMCTINTICSISGTVSCVGGGGIETLELVAYIFDGTKTVVIGSTCYFYVQCGQSSENTGSPQPVYSAPVCHDRDNDGITNCNGDCNGYDPTVYPGAEDICDEIDNDCDGEIDEDCQVSTVTLEVYPDSVSLQETVLLSGTLSPPRVADIHLIFTTPDATRVTTVVDSNEDGTFSFVFEPKSVGTWSVSAFAEGSRTCRPATSGKVFFTARKMRTSLSLDTDSQLLYPRDEIAISGTLLPAITTYITVTIKNENGESQEQVVSSSEGRFSLSYRPESVGVWSVSARFDGTERHEPSSSSTIYFTVAREESALSLSISAEKEKIVEGDTVEITGQIRPSRSTTVSIFLESENGEKMSFQIPSEENGTFSHIVTPESAGMWFVHAHVPEETLYTEVKSAVLSFPVELTVPDLAITNLIIDPSSAEPDDVVRIRFHVENLGSGAAENIAVVVAGYGVNTVTIHEHYIDRISAQTVESIDVKWPADDGVDMLSIDIDPLNSIQELREDNNRMTHEMDIRFRKDISIKNVYFSSEEVKEGEILTITAEIHCEGNIPLCEIEFWDGEPEKGSRICTKVLRNFSGGISVERRWAPEPGHHDVHVVADRSREVAEFNEDNNSIEKEVTVIEEGDLPVFEITITVIAASGGIYWYLKNVRPSPTHVKKIPQNLHRAGEPLRHASGISTAGPSHALPSGFDASTSYPHLCKATRLLLEAGKNTAAAEIGAKLYRILYRRYSHWNKAQEIDFEDIVQNKLNLLERVITHLFVFEGYIDTEEFCRFFSVNEQELLEILNFLHKNGYIEGVAS